MRDIVRHVREMRNPKGILDKILEQDNWETVEIQNNIIEQVCVSLVVN